MNHTFMRFRRELVCRSVKLGFVVGLAFGFYNPQTGGIGGVDEAVGLVFYKGGDAGKSADFLRGGRRGGFCVRGAEERESVGDDFQFTGGRAGSSCDGVEGARLARLADIYGDRMRGRIEA